MEMGQNEGRLLDFLDSNRAIIILLFKRTIQVQMHMGVILQEKERMIPKHFRNDQGFHSSNKLRGHRPWRARLSPSLSVGQAATTQCLRTEKTNFCLMYTDFLFIIDLGNLRMFFGGVIIFFLLEILGVYWVCVLIPYFVF